MKTLITEVSKVVVRLRVGFRFFAVIGGLAVVLLAVAGRHPGYAASQQAAGGPTASVAPRLDNSVVKIVIDGRSYTRDDFDLYVKYLAGQDVPKPNDTEKFIGELVLDHVAYDEALREFPGLDNSPIVRSRIRKFLIRVYGDRYLARLRNAINPSRDELLRLMPDPKPRYIVSVIVCRGQERLDEATDALAKGEAFAAVAEKYSEGLSSEKGGRISPIEEGNYVLFNESEFEHIRALKKGEVSKPFKTRVGWVVARLDDFLMPTQIKEKALADGYQSILDGERSRQVAARLEELGKQAKVEIDNAVVRQVREFLEKGQPLTDALGSAALAKVNGEPIVADEIEDLRQFHSVDSLESGLDRRVRNEILIGQALKEVPADELSRRIEMAKRRLVTRMFFRKKAESFGATPQELKDFYAKNPQLFRTEETRKLLIIQTADRKKADEAARLAKKGKDFAQLAGRLNDDENHRKVRGDAGFVRKKDLRAEMRDAVYSAAQGAVLGPFTVGTDAGTTNYILVKVVRISKPEQIPFEKLNRDVLADKVVSRKMDEFYRGFLADIYKTHQIQQFN